MSKASKKSGFSIGETATSVMSGIAGRVETSEFKAKNDIREINVNKIKPSPQNSFGIRDIEKLAESIREYGQLENAVVRPIVDNEFEFEMISGHRRQEAIKSLGFETILCKVVEADDLLAESMLIIANLETRELTDLEKSNSAVRLAEIVDQRRKNGEDFGGKKTREIVAEMMSTEAEKISPAKVQKLLKVQELIPEFKEQVEKGELSLEKANQFAQMPPEQQLLIFQAFEEGKALTAQTAKELKDKLQEAQDNHKQIVEEMKEDMRKKEEETKEFKEQAEETAEKLKKVEGEKKTLETKLKDSQKKIDELDNLHKKALEEINETKDSLREELENEIKNNVNNENEQKIRELEEKLKAETDKENEIKSQYEKKVEELNKELEEKEKALKEKRVEADIIDGNKAIQSLARQAQKALMVLLDEVTKCTTKEGFILSDDTKAILKEISKYQENI